MTDVKKPRFSARTDWDLEESELAAAVRQRRSEPFEVFDLTVSNPTTCGFVYRSQQTLAPLLAPAALLYDPDPRGLHTARQAVAEYYREHSAAVDPDALVLTTSTSEAYSFLFRLLCDSGDTVLVAQPGYPLFDFLATLDDVHIRNYPLFYDFGWWIDFAELERRITPQTRAVLLVHPNNPTGHITRATERRRLEDLCRFHGLALIVDEVFLDYGLGAQRITSFAVGPHPCLTFVVSGLSKIAALPQMKIGWLAAFGPDDLRSDALRRLEVIADTFLSLNAPAQLALPVWLKDRHAVASQIRARVLQNLTILEELGVEHLPVEAGWAGILRLSINSESSEELALRLVRELGVMTHPASFYGMHGNQRVVVSLIVQPEMLRAALGKLKHWSESRTLT
jgi:aspartate/methionine/tyrosine aminotransferase